MLKRLLLGSLLLVILATAITLGTLQFSALRAIDQTLSEPPPAATVSIPRTTAQGASPQAVIFVGNNWQGSITVVDALDYRVLGTINGIPDKRERLEAIKGNFLDRMMFFGIRHLIGEGNDQYVDDMYSTLDGRRLIVSRPSFADVVAIDINTGAIDWRFEVAGVRADHMALSPDGRHVAVSASTGNVVHVIDVATGEEFGRFPTGDSPHENVFSKDGKRIFHASIGRVFSPFDSLGGGFAKGERRFQVVDAQTMEVLERWDMREKLDEFGLPDVSPAIRPMAHSSDERLFYFQLSFLHGFVEYDLEEGRILRKADLPKITTAKRTEYINDSAHHGIAISGDDRTLCVAGTMDDYVALVDVASLEAQILSGLGEKPYWVVADRSGERCFISWSGTDQMSVIDIDGAREIARVDVGDHPQRIREGYVTGAWYRASGRGSSAR